MTTNPHNPAEPSEDDEPLGLSTEAVIARLDQLWSNQAASQAMPNYLGQQIGRYSLERLLGSGSFGVVYLASDPQLQRQVALKIPRPEVVVDLERRQRFENEASAAAGLDHSLIVPILDANFESPIPYIASAYCPGPDLSKWLEKYRAATSWLSAVQFVAQLAQAVHYAHQQGVYHRDIKPSNVMLTLNDPAIGESSDLQDYSPRLTDFGLAQFAAGQLTETRSSMLIGTPLYMAPEQLQDSRNRDHPAATDVYALGCLLFELLTGRLPIEGNTYVEIVDRLREAPPTRLRTLRDDLPRSLELICAKCLEKDPAARYPSVAALSQDLEACLEGKSVTVARTSVFDRFRYWQHQPKRIRDAGLFSIGFHTMSFLWLVCCAIALPQFDVIPDPDDLFHTYLEMLIPVVFFDLPMIFIGWQTLRANHWSIQVGIGWSAFLVVFILFAITGVKPVFAAVYQNANYFVVTNFSLLLICAVTQLLLYLFALRASRRTAA